MFVLDTNVVSELRKAKSGRADPALVSWAQSVPSSALHLSVVSLMELELGVLLKARKDARQAETLGRWLERIRAGFAGRLLPIDDRVALRCAALHVPDPRPERDAVILATAAVHGLTLVTRNTRDFTGAGVVLLDPWGSADG